MGAMELESSRNDFEVGEKVLEDCSSRETKAERSTEPDCNTVEDIIESIGKYASLWVDCNSYRQILTTQKLHACPVRWVWSLSEMANTRPDTSSASIRNDSSFTSVHWSQ